MTTSADQLPDTDSGRAFGALRLEPTMGTIVTLDIRDRDLPRPILDAALDAAVKELHHADRVFSTYDQDSDISRLRTGRITLDHCAPDVREVLGLCELAKQHTDGWFDPWAMPGGVDPTGLVKGWAARQALRALSAHGVRHAMVNAAGDLAVIGNASGVHGHTGWRIAVANPTDPRQPLEVLEVTGLGVATSAAYERGPLSMDPHNQKVVQRLASATVTAPDLAMADAYATAAVAHGPAALEWLSRLTGVGALLVTLHGSVLQVGRAAA